VRYSNSWVRTAKWHAEEAAQLPLASGFLDDNPVKALVHATVNVASWAFVMPILAMDWDAIMGAGSGCANTSVVKHAGRVLALQDGANPIEMEMKSLATKGPLAGHSHFTAHPKVCPKTGELIWYDYSNPAGLTYGVWDRLGQPIHQTVVPMPRNVLVHDIAVTERYTIIPDCPLLLTPDLTEGHGPVHLRKDVPMRIGVLPRHGGGEEVDWYEVRGPGKCCFHMMNAHETDSGDIVVVGCAMPDFSFWDMNVAHAHKQKLIEWHIDRKTRRATERVVSNLPCDFPAINDNYLGQPFRYGYSAAFNLANRKSRSMQFSGIAKHDVKTTETLLWEGGEGVLVGEPVFVPRASAGPLAEDDGYLLTFARDERTKCSEVLIFDAKDFGRPPICRMRLPRRVPHGFHCAWIPADENRQELRGA
jgi:carotenoid cleavage dioxygenase